MHKKKVILSGKGGQRGMRDHHSRCREPCGKEHGKTEVIGDFSSVSRGNDCVKPPSSSEPLLGSGRLKN